MDRRTGFHELGFEKAVGVQSLFGVVARAFLTGE